ncbi:MAG: hybrid sensor histidine kinase/response regulator [Anaerolineae bacterium]|nr:hybrid sensor histidine kinase/response regulator [Anaerolineae bacterium]
MVSSTVKSGQNLDAELRPSSKLVAFLLMCAALAVSLIGDTWLGESEWQKVLLFGLLLYSAAGVVWLLDEWRPQVGGWGAVMALVVVSNVGLFWLGVPGFLTLLTIPVVVAAVLLGLLAATITAVGQTVVLLLLYSAAPFPVNLPTTVTILIGVWFTLGLVIYVYHSMYQIVQWSWEHYQQAQDSLEEARDRKVELEQALEALALANRELVLLNERVANLRLLAEEAQKAKTAFVAKVSHEFRTPLNMIIGLTDILIEKPEVVYGNKLPAPLLEDLKIVHRSCEHLSSMVNDVLDLSQTELGRLTLHREWVDLAQEINAAVTVVQPLLEKKDLSLQLTLPNGLPQVYCDRTRIRQVILNLVSNAARYTDTGGITIGVVQQGRFVTVNVTDTGSGIAPEDAQKIFDPFFQVRDNLWREQEGSGLGLSISKQFVERHDGEIWLESKRGVGSTFAFKLPISPAMGLAAGPARWVDDDWVFRERTSWPKVSPSPYKQRVVLCDETGDLYPLFTTYADDIEFVDAQNLSQTRQELQECPAHAVILNSISPNHLKIMVEQARQEIPDTPIIGCSLPPRADHALKSGAIGRLIKPVRQSNLEEAIQKIDSPVKRVLVVDDAPDVVQLFSRMLHIYDDTLEIITAADGKEALHQLRAHLPDLVLLDIILPDVDGWQVLANKAQDEAIKDIPVIVVSAEDLVEQTKSEVLLATMGAGLSVSQVLRCSLQLSELLFEPG